MMWISLADLELPSGWIERKEEKLGALTAAGNDAAARRILLDGALRIVWTSLRGQLAKLSHGKCWYCEAPVTRQDSSVDHFRPKGKVYEDVAHPGYWWLALDYENFRLSCQYCNERRVDRVGGTEGGKATHFPLTEWSIRAYKAVDIMHEYPVLLDPTVLHDPGLLKFTVDGRVGPSAKDSEDPTNAYRARRSITIYHLDHHLLTPRRAQVAMQVRESVVRTDLAYRRYLDKTDPRERAEALDAYSSALSRVGDYIKRSSPFSGTARGILRWERNEQRPWIDSILQVG